MILAFDTSSRWMSVALFDGVNVLSEVVWHAPDYHTAQLAPVAEDVLKRGGVAPAELAAVGVALGPGGYTGLRVGLAFAKGLALAANLALVGVPTLDTLAAAQVPGYVQRAGCLPGAANVWIAAFIQAGRGRFGVGWYRIAETLDVPARCLQESAALTTLDAFLTEAAKRSAADGSLIYACGEFTRHDREILEAACGPDAGYAMLVASPAQCLRRPGTLAELAWLRYQKGMTDNPATLAPLYLQ